MTTQIHDAHDDDVMTAKHGATTDWMQANGECLASLEEGDRVHVIDEYHASTSTDTEYIVRDVPTMEYSFHHPAIEIGTEDNPYPPVTIKPGKVSKTATR